VRAAGKRFPVVRSLFRAERKGGIVMEKVHVGKTVWRYVLRNKSGVTIRKFRTNDGEFAGRVIEKTRSIHGVIRVDAKEVSAETPKEVQQ
jgi:hypothetical protein